MRSLPTIRSCRIASTCRKCGPLAFANPGEPALIVSLEISGSATLARIDTKKWGLYGPARIMLERVRRLRAVF